MKKRILTCLLTILVLGLASTADAAEKKKSEDSHPSSPWLAHDAFEAWLATNLKDKPFYVIAAEGRLHHGVPQWRVRSAALPVGVEWYWWYGSTAPEYAAHAEALLPKGFDQIWLQSFVDDKGVRKYQSIYLKLTGHPDGKPLVPSTLESPAAAIEQPPAPAAPSPAVSTTPTPVTPTPPAPAPVLPAPGFD